MINSISEQLGIPWELSKDTEFSSCPVFLGFKWDLTHKTVKLTDAKCLKYVGAIKKWLQSETHTLSEVEKLYGKLVHASLVIPEGAAYITSLQRMLALFSNQPFMTHPQPRGTVLELNWWLRALKSLTQLPSPTLSKLPITVLSQMPALVLVLPSSLEITGMPGGSGQAGTQTAGTLDGQKVLALNSLLQPSSCLTTPAYCYWFMETIRASSKPGGKVKARMQPPMPPSVGSLPA